MKDLEVPDLDGAICSQTDPELFFPEGFNHTTALRATRKICGACPVLEDCLMVAIANHEDGIWAGSTTFQRRSLRRSPRAIKVHLDLVRREAIV